MRIARTAAAAVVVLAAAFPTGAAQPRAVVERALDACGGETAFSRLGLVRVTIDEREITADGKEKWSYPVGDRIEFSSPAIGKDGTIYIGCYDDHLYAMNPDGTLKWASLTSSSSSSAL